MVEHISNIEEYNCLRKSLEACGKHPIRANRSMNSHLHRIWTLGIYIHLSVLFVGQILANDERTRTPTRSFNGWYQSFESGGVHQFESDMDAGGGFGVSRFLARASVGYRKDILNSISLSFGYAHTAYQFDSLSAPWAPEPWGNVHTLSLSAPIRRSIGSDWMFIGIPSIRTISEDSANLKQSIIGGGITGISYRVRPGLSIGPGFGVLTQLEDSVNLFPIVLVDWAISEKLKLQTGRGFGASQGPGLELTYTLTDTWSIMLGGRFERFRFRLNSRGQVPNGVGEDRKASVSLGAKYALGKMGFISVYSGINLVGDLELDDANGNEIMATDYQSAPFIGLNASFRF